MRSDARRYLAGQTLSLLGDSSMWMAGGIWVKSLIGSTVPRAWCSSYPPCAAVAAPLAGLVVDRVRRRPLLVTLNLLGALILVPLFAVQDAGDVRIAYVVMLLHGIVNIAIAPVQSALLHRMLPTTCWPARTVRCGPRGEPADPRTAGAGPGLYAAFSGRAVAILDIIAFLAAAAFIVSLSVREPRPGRADGHVLAGVFDGLQVQKSEQPGVASGNDPWHRPHRCDRLQRLHDLGGDLNDGLHRPPEFAGILQLAQGVGAITARLSPRPR